MAMFIDNVSNDFRTNGAETAARFDESLKNLQKDPTDPAAMLDHQAKSFAYTSHIQTWSNSIKLYKDLYSYITQNSK